MSRTATSRESRAGSTPRSPIPRPPSRSTASLFGWEFENVMPPGCARPVLHRPPRGGDVAAIGSQPEGAPRPWLEHLRLGRGRRRDRREGARRRRHACCTEPYRRRRRRAAWRCSPTRPAPTFSVWQPGAHRGAAVVNEHGVGELQRPAHAATSTARARSTARCSAGSCSTSAACYACGRCPATATSSRSARPGMRENMADDGRARRASRRSSRASSDPTDGPPAHWGVTFGVDDADADRRARRRARRHGCSSAPFDAPWVAHDGHRRPAGRDVHGQPVRAGEQGPGAAGGRGRGVMRAGRAPQAAPAPCSAIQSRVSMSQNASPAYSR